MTTEQQERAFLTYLSALENGNLDEIVAYLKAAETDETLEKMMTEYHEEEQVKEKPKIITPRKYKRGQSPRWIRRIGGGLVATFLMAITGFIGIYIGLNLDNTTSITLLSDTIPEIQTGDCYGIATGGIVTTIGNDLSVSNRDIGINESFTIETIETYIPATIQHANITIRSDNINFRGNCDDASTITIYPPNYVGSSCNVVLDTMALYGEETQPNVNQGESIIYDYGQPLLIWSTRTDDIEVISRTSDGDFRAFIPETALIRRGTCDNEPFVYVPNINADGDICEAQLVNIGDTITLEAGLDIDSQMTVAFNNPLAVIVPENQRIAQYHVVFQGIHAEMSSLDIELSNTCEAGQVVRIYPDDNPRQECDIFIARMQFPMGEITGSETMFNNATFGYDIMTLNAQSDNTYQVQSPEFTGTIFGDIVTLNGNCGDSDLLYVPPNNLNEIYETASEYDDYFNTGFTHFNTPEVTLDTLTVVEQRFENGTMFYLPAVEQIWVAYTDDEGDEQWRVMNAFRSPVEESISTMGNFPEIDDVFSYVWSIGVGADDRTLLRYAIGNPTHDAVTHTVYYGELNNNSRIYQLTSYTGDAYLFDSMLMSWQSQ